MLRAVALLVLLQLEPMGLGGPVLSAPARMRRPSLLSLSLAGDCDGVAPSGVTFARTTTATCTKADGSIVTLAGGQPRTSTTLGLLKETLGQNNVLRTEEFELTANWILSGGSPPTITANQLAGPGPTTGTPADRFVFPAVASESTGFVSQTITTPNPSGPNAYSIYARTGSGTFTFYIWDAGASDATSYAACTANASGWTRCPHLFTATSATSTNIRFGFDTRAAARGTPTTAGGTVYLIGAQAEAYAMTSYIPTLGAPASRSADIASMSAPAGLSTSEGCAQVTFTPLWTGGAVFSNPYLLTFGGNHRLLYGSTGDTRLFAYNGTANPATQAAFTTGVAQTYRTTWSVASNAFITRNVTSGAVSGTSPFAGFTAWPATLYLGENAGASQAGGWLANLVFGATATGCP